MSARPRRQTMFAHPPMAEQIKTAARQQMAEFGTAGLTLRGIARQLDITAPAIYNYFPRLDDLINALIVDTFTRLAEAMERAEAAVVSDCPYDRVVALCLAYRQWAVEHPVDFQLIYGNPIPGYVAPPDLTVPLARRAFLGLFRWFIRAYQAGELIVPPEYANIPPEMADAMAEWRRLSGIELPYALLGLLMSGWSRIHGAVLLELYDHIQPLVGDSALFYRYQVDAFLQHLGLQPADARR